MFLAALCVIGLSTAGPARADAVDEYLRAEMVRSAIPGLSIVVRHDGEIVRIAGYGYANLEHAVPASADTVYQSGSLGKQFTAAGILLLAEDGRLSLDDRLARFFPDGPSAWHRITVRHLLTHTSGLRDYDQQFDLRRDYTEDEYLAILRTIPLDFEPGTQFSYSNTGYMLLGILVSKLAGRHWSDFLAERLFRPLGMTATRLISERDIVLHRAAGYELDERRRPTNQAWVAPSINSTGDGALYFSVRDLAAWDAALDARRFLRPEHFAAWWSPVALANGTTYPYGFGWSLEEQRGYPTISHGGSWQGFRTAFYRYPAQRLSVAVLANLDTAEPDRIAQTIAGLVEPALRLPDTEGAATDPDPARTRRLREVLVAYSQQRRLPDMARPLAETATGSAREASRRADLGLQLAAAGGFRFLAADDLSRRRLDLYGERITAIVYYALDTPGAPRMYRFRLNARGQVVDFDTP